MSKYNNISEIDKCMHSYICNQELPNGALLIRKNDELVYQNKWGYQRVEDESPIQFNSIYRMMSMSKCVTAVCVLKLIEDGKLALDEPLHKYIPEFSNMRVSCDKRYVFKPYKMLLLPWYMLTFDMGKVKTEVLRRPITIRDLLCHSCGIEQGVVGMLGMLKGMKHPNPQKDLKSHVLSYTNQVLGFQPGTDTGYSPMAAFDILGYLISLVSGMAFEAYMQEHICKPLGMADTTFFLSEEQKNRLVDVYERKKGKLINQTGKDKDMQKFIGEKEIRYEHGSGGLFSTVVDYERFASMLLNNGVYEGVQILKTETVELIHTEANAIHLEPDPGMVWGLGVKIRQDKKKYDTNVTEGTYGWSGAFGTHFFVSPKDKLEAVFVTNRTDLGGSGSYVSKKIEELAFDIFGNNQ
ncbi:MAG: beta-lactamase family protein [Agathobacter sp.]|nr:beta-lactamase family protein [Agathobacter sp.]